MEPLVKQWENAQKQIMAAMAELVEPWQEIRDAVAELAAELGLEPEPPPPWYVRAFEWLEDVVRRYWVATLILIFLSGALTAVLVIWIAWGLSWIA